MASRIDVERTNLTARLPLLEAALLAIDNSDEISGLIRGARDRKAVLDALESSRFGLSEEQARVVASSSFGDRNAEHRQRLEEDIRQVKEDLDRLPD